MMLGPARKATLFSIGIVAVLVFVLSPRPQPQLDVTVWESPPRHAIAPVGGRLDIPEPVEVDTPETFEDYARTLTGSAEQFSCLYELWWHESKWDPDAEGPTNDHGIPQANADVHPETSEARWRADGFVQVRWGVEYIRNRYGSPCEAWDAWKGRGQQRADGSWWGGWY